MTKQFIAPYGTSLLYITFVNVQNQMSNHDAVITLNKST